MKKYVLGMDFGTLSARAIIVDALSGEELSESVFEYPHGVMDRELPDGTLLPPRCALEHPGDYLVAMKRVISEAIALAGLTADDISGVGLDFTGCTMLAVDENATPLCFDDKYPESRYLLSKITEYAASGEWEDAPELSEESICQLMLGTNIDRNFEK